MAATQTVDKVSLKLLVDKETNKVMLAEAGNDFVDVLFSFLVLPLGTIASLVRKESEILEPLQVGCISSLYESVAEDLDKVYYPSKELLLMPRNSSERYCKRMKLNIDDTETNLFNTSFANFDSSKIDDTSICKGYVKGSETFIITDDLIVVPISLGTTFDMLLNCGIKTMSSVQKVTVNVTKEKALDLLKCSVLSNSTLTDLFLKKKPFLKRSCFSPCGVENNSSMSIKTDVKLVTRKSNGKVLFAQAGPEFAEFISIKTDVKLVTRKSNGKVLFAQAGPEFAAFILSFLTLPLGRVTHMLGGKFPLGCVDGLYKSVVDLDENKYFLSEEVKKWLVNDDVDQHQFTIRISSAFGCGPAPIFNITDELVVVPVSNISTVSLLIMLEIPLSDLKEKIVTIGAKEGLSILKASLTSRSALTNGLAHLLTKADSEK